MERIYLDFNASTPVAPEVAAAMRPYLHRDYGNPSSRHWAGQPAKRALDDARADVAALVGAAPAEIVFTSGGSEANNLALKGLFFKARARRSAPHVITTTIEHPAILEPARFLETLGASVTRLPVDVTGMVDPSQVRRAIMGNTILITVMHANNEVGTIQPIAEIGAIAHEHGIPLHTDAAQSVGKIRADVDQLGVDLMSIAGHKLYAPKGVGALYVRTGVELEPLVHGAGQQGGRRAGTESVLLAVGLGAACRLAREHPSTEHLAALTAHFWARLQARLGSLVVLNGHPQQRLPNTLNVGFRDMVGQQVLDRLQDVAASTGSACHSGSYEMSPVLQAMGREPAIGLGAIRFSVGRPTTMDELDLVVERLHDEIELLTRTGFTTRRVLSPNQGS